GAARTAGRAGAADAARRPRAGGPQVHAARDAGAAARHVEPRGGRLSLDPPAVPLGTVSGRTLRAVLVAGLGRWGPLRGRGRLSAQGGPGRTVASRPYTGLSMRECTSSSAVAKP